MGDGAEVVAGAGVFDVEGGAEDGVEGVGGHTVAERAGVVDAAFSEGEEVGELGENLLNVVSDEDEAGGVFTGGEGADVVEETLAGDGVEARAGFVKNEKGGGGHEGAGDEDALALALGENLPTAVGEVADAHEGEEAEGTLFVNGLDTAPDADHGLLAADDDLQGGVLIVDEVGDAGADDADALAEFAPVALAEGFAKKGDLAIGGRHVSGESLEERGLAGAVGTEDDPVLAFVDGPIDGGEDVDGVAVDAEIFDVKKERTIHRERRQDCWLSVPEIKE